MHTKWKISVAAPLALLCGLAAPGLIPWASATNTNSQTPARFSAGAPPTLTQDAAGWLGRQFLSNGNLPKAEGEAGLDNLPLALTALVAAETGSKQAKAGLAYLEAHFNSFVSEPVSKTQSVVLPGRMAEVILAAVATGASPTAFGGDKAANNLVARLLATEKAKGGNAGLFGSPSSPTYSSAYTEGLSLLALVATGHPNAAGAGWLVRQQCSNGGWISYRADVSKGCPAEDPAEYAGADTNSTALAIEALVASKTDPRTSPIPFLEKSQYPDGGWGYIGQVAKSQPVDPDSTAVVIQALVALGQLDSPAFSRHDGASPEVALKHFQLGCAAPAGVRGAYYYTRSEGPSLYATIQAIPAASGKAYPIGKGTLSGTLPSPVCSSTKKTSPVAAQAKSSSMEKTCPSVPKPASGQVVVPIVVDFGSAASRVDVTCVAVAKGSTGSDVLAARAAALHTAQPVYGSSGLLCRIDGYPTSGCGAQSGSHYAYWAYFHGGSKWTYSSDGPAENRVSAGDVEGWRFEPDGSATPSDPPPRAASSVAALEATSTAPTTTTTTTTTPPVTTAPRPGATTTSSSVAPSTATSTRPSSAATGSTQPGSSSGTGPPEQQAGTSSRSAGTNGNRTAAGSGHANSGLAGTVSPTGSSHLGRDALLALACLLIVAGGVFAVARSRRAPGVER